MKKIDYIVDVVGGKHFAMLWNSRVSFDEGHDSKEKAIKALQKYCEENNITLGERLTIV